MKPFRLILCFSLCALLTLSVFGAANFPFRKAPSTQPEAGASLPNEDKLIYADFETVKENRPVSNREGVIQIFGYQQAPGMISRFKGLEGANPAAPELVRLRKDDPNRAAAFDYELLAPNQYAGVTLEVHGQADKDGKPMPDDVSQYKYLSVQVYATGVTVMTAEFVSKGQGIKMESGFPQSNFRVSPSFNTYKIPLNNIAQPTWVDTRVNPKDVLKKLTSVNLSVTCNNCVPIKGTVVVDNLVFQN
jgi:hypothetical protein